MLGPSAVVVYTAACRVPGKIHSLCVTRAIERRAAIPRASSSGTSSCSELTISNRGVVGGHMGGWRSGRAATRAGLWRAARNISMAGASGAWSGRTRSTGPTTSRRRGRGRRGSGCPASGPPAARPGGHGRTAERTDPSSVDAEAVRVPPYPADSTAQLRDLPRKPGTPPGGERVVDVDGDEAGLGERTRYARHPVPVPGSPAASVDDQHRRRGMRAASLRSIDVEHHWARVAVAQASLNDHSGHGYSRFRGRCQPVAVTGGRHEGRHR
jgi:hypothetical protein